MVQLPEVVERNMRHHQTSLCFYCKNASPKKCTWVANGQRIFDESDFVEIKKHGKKGVNKVEVVRKCNFFALTEIGTPGRKSVNN